MIAPIYQIVVVVVGLLSVVSGLAKATPVTEDEAQQFAEQLEVSMQKHDPAFLNAHFDPSGFYNIVFQNTPVTPQLQAATVQQSGNLGATLATSFLNGIGKSGSYRLLRVVKSDGQFRPLFRAEGTSGLNYGKYLLDKAQDGSIKVLDVDMMATGEPLSATVRRSVLPMIVESNRDALSKLIFSESEEVKHAQEIANVQKLVGARKFGEALTAYDALPESVKHGKNVLICRLTALGESHDPRHLAALKEYEAAFPNDRGIVLLSLDALFLEHKYDEAIKGVDLIDQQVGGDPYLNLYRCIASDSAGNRAAAKAYARKLADGAPWFKRGWMILIEYSIKDTNYAQTAALLDESHEKCGLVWSHVSTSKFFEGFVKSAAYKKWVAHNPQAGEPTHGRVPPLDPNAPIP